MAADASLHVSTLLRPAYEARAAVAWAVALVWLLVFGALTRMPLPAWSALVTLTGLMVALRGYQTNKVWRYKVRLAATHVSFVRLETLRRARKKLGDALWMGWGWTWEPSTTQLAYEVSKMDSKEVYPPRWFLQRLGVEKDPRDARGKAWIHGLGQERDVVIPFADLEGHTGVVATTGAIKTSLYKLIVSQLADAGWTVFVIDPKGDKDLKAALRDVAVAAGEPERFISFHPAFPRESIRLDGLASWERETQVASRIQAITSSLESDNFQNFCWTVTANLVGSMKLVGRRPTVDVLLQHVQAMHNPEQLCEDVLTAYLTVRLKGFEAALAERLNEVAVARAQRKPRPGQTEKPARLTALIELYEMLPASDQVSPVNGLISMLAADRTWFSKMVVAIVPTLTALASLGPLLSPDYDDPTDARPIFSVPRIVDGKHLCYVGTDALSDTSVAAAIAALLVADVAGYAGDRYNYHAGKPPKVAVLVDEAGDAACLPIIQNLNKGRGAGLYFFLAFQALADLVTALGNSQPHADRVLANINNWIFGATQDSKTLDFVEERGGEVPIRMLQQAQGQGQKTEDVGLEYSANRSIGTKETLVPLIPRNLLMGLPNLHYLALIARSKLVKGRVPVVTFDADAGGGK